MKVFNRFIPATSYAHFPSCLPVKTAAIFFLIFAATTAHATAVISVIPTLGGRADYAWAINDSGTVVGDTTQTNSTTRVPYVWNPSTGPVALGTLTTYGGYAYGINNNGLIVGQDVNISENGNAVKWNGTSAPVTLTAPGNIDAFASTVNNNGVVVGSYFDGGTVNNHHAARWNADGSFLDLGTLGTDITSSAAAINDSGTIVGYSQNSTGTSTAFIYTSASGMQKISAPSGVSLYYAQAINNSGTVVGGGSTGAYQWSPTSGFQSLGGTLGGTAEGINDSGTIVGYGYSGSNQTAWIWSNGSLGFSGVQNLNALLSPADAARWTLQDAVDINNLNQIVGYGLYDDDNNPSTPAVTRAFILSLPEPTTLCLMALGTICIFSRRHQPQTKQQRPNA